MLLQLSASDRNCIKLRHTLLPSTLTDVFVKSRCSSGRTDRQQCLLCDWWCCPIVIYVVAFVVFVLLLYRYYYNYVSRNECSGCVQFSEAVVIVCRRYKCCNKMSMQLKLSVLPLIPTRCQGTRENVSSSVYPSSPLIIASETKVKAGSSVCYSILSFETFGTVFGTFVSFGTLGTAFGFTFGSFVTFGTCFGFAFVTFGTCFGSAFVIFVSFVTFGTCFGSRWYLFQ